VLPLLFGVFNLFAASVLQAIINKGPTEPLPFFTIAIFTIIYWFAVGVYLGENEKGFADVLRKTAVIHWVSISFFIIFVVVSVVLSYTTFAGALVLVPLGYVQLYILPVVGFVNSLGSVVPQLLIPVILVASSYITIFLATSAGVALSEVIPLPKKR